VQAGKLAGLLGDVINDSAADQHLAMGGYGVTGVCNDSIAVLQQALAGRVTAYPLLERDETLAQELGKHIAAGGPDADAFRTLAASLAAVPNDMTPNASARERALASLPWAPGEEPFQSAVDARAILEGSAGA
jgi:hypothetical protein